jgi:hypothetical protein
MPWFQECRLVPEWLVLREVKGRGEGGGEDVWSWWRYVRLLAVCDKEDHESQAPFLLAAICMHMQSTWARVTHRLVCYHAIRSARFSFLCAVDVKQQVLACDRWIRVSYRRANS